MSTCPYCGRVLAGRTCTVHGKFSDARMAYATENARRRAVFAATGTPPEPLISYADVQKGMRAQQEGLEQWATQREPVVLCPICHEALVERLCQWHGYVSKGFATDEEVQPTEPQYSEVGVLNQRIAITTARQSLMSAFVALPEGTLKTTAYKAAQQALESAEYDLIQMLAHIEGRKK